MIRRTSLVAAVLSAAFLSGTSSAWSAADSNYADVKAQIAKQHDEGVQRLQDWIKLPSIAAEDLNYPQGADYMIKLL
nr:twin-arginine translocation pathway signal protein [Chthoniobacterales bacterium]